MPGRSRVVTVGSTWYYRGRFLRSFVGVESTVSWRPLMGFWLHTGAFADEVAFWCYGGLVDPGWIFGGVRWRRRSWTATCVAVGVFYFGLIWVRVWVLWLGLLLYGLADLG